MKEIYFLRHAHAPDTLRVEDVERPIDVKGKMEASRVAAYVKNILQAPDVCYVSHAKRAQQTAAYFKEIWDINKNCFLLTSELYDFNGDKVKNFIYNLSEEWNRVLLVGHNFGITEVVNYFGDKSVNALPTSGLVHITFEADTWHGLRKGTTNDIILPDAI